MKIIGLSGTNGSGKDTVGELLAEEYNLLFVSVSDMIRAEAMRRGEPIERVVLRKISGEWRKQHGLGILVDKAVEEFNKQARKYNGLAITSLRNTGEAQRVHELGGVVVWLDADPELRYQRIQSRGRSIEDSKTLEQFIAEEKVEMENGGDDTQLNTAAVREMADIVLENNSDEIQAFQRHVLNELRTIL